MVKSSNFIIAILFCVVAFGNNVQGGVASELREVYISQVGVREKTGQNDGVMVEQYLESVGRHRGDAWCAAFVYWCHHEVGIKAPKSGWSPSWFTKKNTIYIRGVDDYKEVRQGDVFGLYFNSLGRIGHVGFVDIPGENVTITVEGNTNEAGSREGDGVYRKRRLSRQIYKVSRYI